jgi:hypothetical protein
MKAKNILLTASLCAGIGLATLVGQTGDQQQQPTPTSSPHEHDGHDEHAPAQYMAMMKQAGKSTGTIMHCAMMGCLEVDAYDPATVLAMKEQLNLTAEQ